MALTLGNLADPTYESNEIAGVDNIPHFYESWAADVPIWFVAKSDEIYEKTAHIDITKVGRQVTMNIDRWAYVTEKGDPLTDLDPRTIISGTEGDGYQGTEGYWTTRQPDVGGPWSDPVRIPRRFLPSVGATDLTNFKHFQDVQDLGRVPFPVTVFAYTLDATKTIASFFINPGVIYVQAGNAPSSTTPFYKPDTYGTISLFAGSVNSTNSVNARRFIVYGNGLLTDTTVTWITDSAGNNIKEGWATATDENYYSPGNPPPPELNQTPPPVPA